MTRQDKQAQQAKDTWKAGKYDSLDAMMAAHAAEAVRQARAEYRETLDFTPASVAPLERILNRLCPAPAPLDAEDGEQLTLLWGGFFGELLRHQFGGEWIMSVYPGSEFSVPTLEIAGSRLYPLLKVNRRLTLGAGEDLQAFHAMIATRLAATSKAN